jgi:hypothetical protein
LKRKIGRQTTKVDLKSEETLQENLMPKAKKN